MKKYSHKIIGFLSTLILMFTCTINFCHADILTGLVGWWQLEEGSGNTAYDYSGNNNSVGLYNGPIWVAGNIGPYAISMNGASSQFGETSTGIANMAGATAGTLCGWAYRSSTSNTLAFGIDPGGGSNRFVVLIWSDGNVYNEAEGTTGGNYPYYSYNTLGWHQYCMVFNGSLSQTSRVVGYVDGVSQTITQAGDGNPTSISGTANFYIGFALSNGVYSNGDFEDVRIYDRALSSSDISQLYAYTYTKYTSFQAFKTTPFEVFQGTSFTIY